VSVKKEGEMGKDRFLIGILVGISVLVVAALILFFFRQGRVDYGDESTPAGVLQNYFIAIQKRDYRRAYGYLAEQPGKPDLTQFQQPFLSYQQDAITGSAVEVGQTFLDQQNETATVQVTILNSTRDVFGSSVRQVETATLVQQNGTWKVMSAPYPYGNPEYPQKAFPSELQTPLPSPTPAVTPSGTAP
jgi:hypothetical protein